MSDTKRLKLEKKKQLVQLTKNKFDECLPIKSINDLRNWKPSIRSHVTIPLKERVEQICCPKTLLCHDMRGGYLDDRYINGSDSKDNYYFVHWTAIDIFVYFSHHFITIPPCSWISASHKNGVKILGTIITEWDDGKKICEELFKDENAVDDFSKILVDIADYYNFDGWLINIENKLQPLHIPHLQQFVKQLTEKMHLYKSGSQVLWYDSVLKTGELKWQNALNEKNKIFFDCCDGIFLNYNWTEETLQKSVEEAGDRAIDVYVGVDVFGRGCLGGGGFNTSVALAEARKLNLPVAIFAPGWVHECLEVQDFKENQQKFWNELQKFCPPRIITELPYYTSFCPGYGKRLFKNGQIIKDEPWYNIGLQDPQPIYYSDHCSNQVTISVYDEDAFNGGGCICLKGTPPSETQIILNYKLLETSFLLKESFIVSYTFKPLTPNVKVNLVLHMKNIGKEYKLPLSSRSSTLISSATEESMNENWIKKSYTLKYPNFIGHSIAGISVEMRGLKNEEYSALLGELKIMPLQRKIIFNYKELKCEYDEKGIHCQCTLYWTPDPSICYSDLFFVIDGDKNHICRTTQFYYQLEFDASHSEIIEILLSVHSCEKDNFAEYYSCKIPCYCSKNFKVA